MLLLLLALFQPQQPRISRVVIVGAILVFVAGVSLLVYFYRRYKRSEKEPEEDWDMARRSLFVNVPPPKQKVEEEATSPLTTEISTPVSEMPAPHAGGTREFVSGIELVESAPQAQELQPETGSLPEPALHAPAIEHSPLPDEKVEPTLEPSLNVRPTEILASLAPQEPLTSKETEPEVFDEEVWAGLEIDDQPLIVEEEKTRPAVLESSPPPPVARVEQRANREPFEAPRIKRIEHREPYETPRIEELAPRDQASATQALRSAPPPVQEPGGSDRGTTRQAGATGLFGSLPRSDSTEGVLSRMPAASETRDLAALERSPSRVSAPSVAGTQARKATAGSILGLPSEPAYGPLILGDVVRNADDVGIDALSNYGKDVGPKGGRGGTIALLAVVILLAGAVLLYLFVPSIHSRVGSLVGPGRAAAAQAAQEAAMKPKVQIIPSFRPDVNKNLVTARGAVDNISDEQLENLAIEVSLQRGADTPPEIRSVSVVPNPLPANQRGTFEFEYDGKRDTGFTGYKITRVFSNGTEIKFRSPGK